MAKLSPERIYAELSELLQVLPKREDVRLATPSAMAWVGNVSAVLREWDSAQAILFDMAIGSVNSDMANLSWNGWRDAQRIINTAHQSARLTSSGSLATAVEAGEVFRYFDELRSIVARARKDIIFIDPYIYSDFVSAYLPQIADGVAIRLLTGSKSLGKLLPGLKLFSDQYGRDVQVRTAAELHDRFVILDGSTCYQSGASFKDGARNAPTTIAQLIDAFDPVRETYERIWSSADVAWPRNA